jgi:carbon storage regulator
MQIARTDIQALNEGYAMLVLTRRAGESIMIDNDIELKVLKIRGSQVHLGIDAPKRAAVHRKEVWLRIQDENSPEAPHAPSTTPNFRRHRRGSSRFLPTLSVHGARDEPAFRRLRKAGRDDRRADGHGRTPSNSSRRRSSAAAATRGCRGT